MICAKLKGVLLLNTTRGLLGENNLCLLTVHAVVSYLSFRHGIRGTLVQSKSDIQRKEQWFFFYAGFLSQSDSNVDKVDDSAWNPPLLRCFTAICTLLTTFLDRLYAANLNSLDTIIECGTLPYSS